MLGISAVRLPKKLSSQLLGSILLAVLLFVVLAIQPFLTKILPAANVGFLLRDGRYLILFQNNAELRASGGFIGSFGELEINNGIPQDIVFGTNVHTLDQRLTDQVTIPPPAPLAGINSGKWAFRDSNWAADFPEASKQILWFYEREQELAGEKKEINGVIAITTTVVEELMKLTGPIEMPEYATTLTAENFAEVVQYKIEREYFENKANWPINEPKTILKDFIPLLEDRLRSADRSQLLDLGFRLLDEKYILLFSRDRLAQRLIEERNWGGAVDQATGNYLMIVNSNIGGLKSSRKIEEKVQYSLEEEQRRVTLHIERKHIGTWLWPDGENKNWVRILLPKGTRLDSARFGVADGMTTIETGEEAGKTVFGFWLSTEPQRTQDVTITYVLPERVNMSQLTVQRQPGANPINMTLQRVGKGSISQKIITDQVFAL